VNSGRTPVLVPFLIAVGIASLVLALVAIWAELPLTAVGSALTGTAALGSAYSIRRRVHGRD
jgi:hypothetical protein